MGKLALMSGVAVIAMLSAANASTNASTQDSTTSNATNYDSASQPMVLAANYSAPSNAELEARISALEEELQKSEINQAAAANAAPVAATGWWNDTKISGRMYYDVTNISNTTNGVRNPVVGTGNGSNFDIKRFYVGIDHTFDSMFSANITTDTTYDSGTAGIGQIFIKKAYLQAKIDPLLTIRLGAADMPWIPYVEGIYGYRYLEKTVVDRTGTGTSSDWGVHILGSAFDGILNYAASAVNGAGYKKIPTGGDTNRFNRFDYEGRISAVYDGFNVAVGGYVGKLGNPSNTNSVQTASRFNVLAAYVADGARIGVEYFNATDYSLGIVQGTTPADGAHGVSTFASYAFLPQWAVFGRYDFVNPNARTVSAKHDEYYTFGVSWSPVKIIDFSLAYKHEAVTGVGAAGYTASNGAIGSSLAAPVPGTTNRGAYNEIGLFGDLQF